MTEEVTPPEQAAVAAQPVAEVPPVAEIPPDPHASLTPESAGPDRTSMTLADQSIHRAGDALTAFYVGHNKASKYKSAPLPEMMPAYLYRCTSSLAQQPMAMLRWVVDTWLARVFVDHAANNLLVGHDWWPNAPAHLRYETALELARVPAEWRPYSLATWTILQVSSKVKGAPDITAKLNPYAVLMQGDEHSEQLRAKMHDDAVCALRYDYDPSPYQMYGRGVHSPSADPVSEWVDKHRYGDAYVPSLDCGVALLDAVKAGVRLYRGPGARKAGQQHEDMMRPAGYTFDPATALTDYNLGQHTDDTTLYLNTTPQWQALLADPMYGPHVHTLMQPPQDEAGGVVYTDEYHAQVTQALRQLPRWSMLWGDSGVGDKSEHPFNHWELDADPKPLATAASTMAQTIQAIGLFGTNMPASHLVDGVALTRSQVSRIDPLLVKPVAGAPTVEMQYAYAKLLHAKSLADLSAESGRSKKLLPAHAKVVEVYDAMAAAQADPSKQEEIDTWVGKQADPSHRADVDDVVGELEFKLMVLRQVQMDKAQAAIDANVATMLKALVAEGDPAHVLSRLDDTLRRVVSQG